MATEIRNDVINPLSSAQPVETQPNMGERTVVNSTDKIKALCQECRTEQGKIYSAHTKRNWIDIAVSVIGVAMIVIGIVLAATGICVPCAALIPVGFIMFFGGVIDQISRGDPSTGYSDAAFALEMQNKDGFLEYAEKQKIDLKIENILESHQLYRKANRIQEARKEDEKDLLEMKKIKEKELQLLDLRLSQLSAKS